MTPYEWAKQFAEQGIRVHPVWWVDAQVDDYGETTGPDVCACSEGAACKSPGKHPITSTTQSTTNEESIDSWWRKYPYANLGVNTDGLTVVDVDYRHGGLESFNLIRDAFPDTFTVKTGNGFHMYFRGEVGKAGGKLARGIDFKSGPSQQVVGPGSTHWTGAEYELASGAPVAALPARVAEMVGRREPSEPSEPIRAEMIHVGEGNDALVAAAAFFANHSRSEEELVGHLFAIAQASMDEPASMDRVREIAHHRWQNHDGRFVDPALGAAFVARVRSQLLNIRELMELPPPEWEVHDLIPRGGLTVLFGDGGTKKSFVALDWSLRAALGLGWHGYALRERRTIYVAAEGVSGIPDRIRAWSRGAAVSLEEIYSAPVWVYPDAVNFRQEEAVGGLIAMAQEHEVDRIVIDKLRRAMPGGDENSATDVGTVVSACDRVRGETGADLLVVHHSPANDAQRPRGSTSIRDDADVVVGLARIDAEQSRMFPSKLKDAAEFEPLALQFAIVDLGEARSSLFLNDVGPAEPEIEEVAAAWAAQARQGQPLCTATTRAGAPCRVRSVRESDPPRCMFHRRADEQ